MLLLLNILILNPLKRSKGYQNHPGGFRVLQTINLRIPSLRKVIHIVSFLSHSLLYCTALPVHKCILILYILSCDSQNLRINFIHCISMTVCKPIVYLLCILLNLIAKCVHMYTYACVFTSRKVQPTRVDSLRCLV